MNDPNHVFVWRTYRGVPFQHHGVELGDGSVVHFTDGRGGIARPGRGAEHFRVCQTPWEQFSPEGMAMVHRVRHSAPLAPEKIRRRALRMVGRSGYDLVSYNCEHFALWCVTGHFHSRQVGIAMERVAAAAAKATMSAAARAGLRSALKLTQAAVTVRRVAHPAMLVPDAAQWATEAVGHHVGLRDPQKRRAAGRTVGATTAALVGLPGGPLGVLATTTLWAIGESAAHLAEHATTRKPKRTPRTPAVPG
ncbi:lecithin retinol acyltransferase family protein [Candidatus Laterigemmans baculatus]|uniref:lecithin retinol acyltransferase family protein n=1 Tax=Candidatus Laterigemmans baculatus TaxID=2770505 RepID=UPI0013DC2CF9|nr:lecithin retinol acyltransferase family protein [Candidatus Laterigemmans baculatus]